MIINYSISLWVNIHSVLSFYRSSLSCEQENKLLHHNGKTGLPYKLFSKYRKIILTSLHFMIASGLQKYGIWLSTISLASYQAQEKLISVNALDCWNTSKLWK